MLKEYASQGTWQIEGTEKNEIPGNKLIIADAEIANVILRETGKTLEEIQKEINITGKPNSFDLKNIAVEFQLAKKVENVFGENIIAITEGSDPVLKNECIVISAHYDHVGITASSEINNGADDNGSGTSALLEIAEAFSKMKKKPRRSVVFAWVTAEEKGLLGSEYYTMYPFFPLEKTVANINLDMIGRSAEKEPADFIIPEKSLTGPNGIYIITGNQSSELNEITNKICRDLHLIPSDALSDEFKDGSDQFNFYKKGIPAVGITTGLHEDYHQPGDDLDKIDFTKMKRICDYTILVVNEIANRKQRLVSDKDSEKINCIKFFAHRRIIFIYIQIIRVWTNIKCHLKKALAAFKKIETKP
ncbi:MAG TPA: M20/M25/M40 family metallo-hydrolase [Draconibacterium sp.]|nr:M20/M25/M40 family metallo-hydrolase [Draconibacterium sp.]